MLPLEMSGNDIAADHSHTTGRTSAIDFRGGIALLGSLGIQWDLTRATAEERADLAAWVGLYKRFRGLLHSGRSVNLDHPDPALLVRGVVAQRRLGGAVHPGAAGFRSGAVVRAGAVSRALTPRPSTWWRWSRPGIPCAPAPTLRCRGWQCGTTLSGRVLARFGLEAPVMDPEQVIVVALNRR